MSEKFTKSAAVNLSHKMHYRLLNTSIEMKLPVSRLLAIALDNELQKDHPFSDLLVKLPEGEMLDYAYADQAGKILSYMQVNEGTGFGIDQLILMRHDIGVPDKTELLNALKECLDKGFVEAVKPKKSKFMKTDFPPGYVHYFIKGANTKEKKKVRKKASDFAHYQRLKKKFQYEEQTMKIKREERERNEHDNFSNSYNSRPLGDYLPSTNEDSITDRTM